jgi:hypothetical protein
MGRKRKERKESRKKTWRFLYYIAMVCVCLCEYADYVKEGEIGGREREGAMRETINSLLFSLHLTFTTTK